MKNDKQAAQQKIKEITDKFNNDMSELQAIIDKPEIVWPPEVGQEVYCIGYEFNTINGITYRNEESFYTRLKQCRLHPTREQAEFYRDFLELESKRTTVRFRLHEFAKRINDGWVGDLNDFTQTKNSIYLDYRNKLIELKEVVACGYNDLPVFKTNCINELREEFTFDEIASLFEVGL